MPDRTTDELAAEAARLVLEASRARPEDRHLMATELATIARRLAKACAALNASAQEDARWSWGVEEAARRLGLTRGYLARRTAHTRRPRTAASKRVEAVRLYELGHPAYRIARDLGMDDHDVMTAVRAAGIPVRGAKRRVTTTPTG